ncbi:MAG: sugar transferase [Clostridium butyricum]|nr:sugar transferase [Clostridium butyricum]
MYYEMYDFIKRLFDIIFSLIALIFLCPILLLVAIIIKAESPGPVIFKQERIGANGKPFKMYKFRSMIADAEKFKDDLMKENQRNGPMFKIKNDPRVTKVGYFIRRTSIDELPQLVNVLKGEMSIVGPRPSLPKEVAQFEPWMLTRLNVKPGLTCYWQVQGRDNIEFEDWMKLDIEYIKDRCFWVDLKLVFKTFFVLLGDKNAS